MESGREEVEGEDRKNEREQASEDEIGNSFLSFPERSLSPIGASIASSLPILENLGDPVSDSPVERERENRIGPIERKLSYRRLSAL